MHSDYMPGGENLDKMMAPCKGKPEMPSLMQKVQNQEMEGSYCNGPLTPPEKLPDGKDVDYKSPN